MKWICDNLKSYMIHMNGLFLSPAELGQGQYRRPPAFSGGPAHNPALAAPDPPASTSPGRVAQCNSGDASLGLVAANLQATRRDGEAQHMCRTTVGREVGTWS